MFASNFSHSRPLVLVFSFLIDRVFGCVEAHGAVMIVTQKMPFLMDADRASHRVRLWRGSLRPIRVVGGGAAFLLLAVCVYVDVLVAVTIVAQKEPFLTEPDPTSHRVRLWR